MRDQSTHQPQPARRSTLLALAAIALWGSLASLGVALRHVPPFLLTGLSLLIGSLIALPLSGFRLTRWRVPAATLALGVYGLFFYHFLLFVALRDAPPVQANLLNYLWPLLIVVLAPVLLPGMTLRPLHIGAAILGFAGAAIVILGGGGTIGAVAAVHWSWGYLAAVAAAFIWASYSLLTTRVAPFPTSAIGGFALLSGLLSLLCHALMEPATVLSTRDWLLIALIGLGPMGAAFFLWDKALKTGDPRQIGILSYLTPLLSTSLLMAVNGTALTAPVALAALMIVLAAWLGSQASAATRSISR
ncbi:MAG: DMT family transporter [Rhodoferax sp.]|nr:DMT family transporter [Rhodoferax sp.]